MRPRKSTAGRTGRTGRAGPAGLGAVALCATAALAVAGCGSGSGSSAPSSSAAPASLTVWRMGASTPAQVTWMNGVVSQYRKAYPAYAKTKVNVVYVPWANATTEFTNALSSGKNAPDVTEIGNTETPTNASLGMLANIDGPWDEAALEQVSTKYKSNWAAFPIPSQNGPSPAPAFAGGSDLAVWTSSTYKTADWDLIKEMDSTSNATSFANLQGFFPPYTSQLTGGAYSGSQTMSGFAKAATVTQISPLNAKNWSTADQTDQIIPTMMKSLMKGADFTSTVDKANTQLQNVLNTGSSS